MLQIVAWTGMLVTRTADRGLTAAIDSTFTGDEPCPLCLAVKAAKNSQLPSPANTPDPLTSPLKLKDLIRSENQIIPLLANSLSLSHAPSAELPSAHHTRSDAPPVPPPRPTLA